MDICTIAQVMAILFQTHMGIPADQLKIQEVVTYAQGRCDELKKKQAEINSKKTEEKKS